MGDTWVVANGIDDMDLSAVFLRVGVALIGPGEHGDFFDCREEYAREMEPQELRMLTDFAEHASVGDRIILRRKHGQSSHDILAIGRIIGPYRHEPIFHSVDIYHWDLQHCRRVLWKELDPPVQTDLPPNRFSRLVNTNILSLLDDLWQRNDGP